MSIFISYRRNETQHIADRIYDRLLVEFGRECVFKDVNAIPLGTDFRDEIRAAVGRCDCLLVVIGPKWSTAVDDKGSRRLEDPLDFVRAEIEAALERKVPIIPLLVDDAKMPRVQDLPAKIQALAYRNGMPVRPDPDFDHDMSRLTGALRRLTRVRGAWRRSPWVKLAAGVVCALGIALLVWFNLPKRAPVDSGKDPMNDTGRATGRDPTGEEQTDTSAERRVTQAVDFEDLEIPLYAAQVRSETRGEWWKHCLWIGVTSGQANQIALVTYRHPQFQSVAVPLESFGFTTAEELEGDYKYSGNRATKFRSSYFGAGYLTGFVHITLYSTEGSILKEFDAAMPTNYTDFSREDRIDQFLNEDGSEQE